MSEFVRYQRVEPVNHQETEGLLDGICHVFYKIDGTNASIWLGDDGELHCGSRNRELSLENDSAGFMNWVYSDEIKPKFEEYFSINPELHLYGEWLDNAWRDFYVFDVWNTDESCFVPYEEYTFALGQHEINWVPELAVIKNPSSDDLIRLMDKCGQFLVRDGEGLDEGIVIKNYDFKNKFGRTIWAKIISNKFKEQHHKVMGAPLINGTLLVEEQIVNKYLTSAMIQKEKTKIEVENEGWTNKCIPQLLGIMFYTFIQEELWTAIKEFKQPNINFKTLNGLITRRVKQEIGL